MMLEFRRYELKLGIVILKRWLYMRIIEKYSKQRRQMAGAILVISYITFICYVLAQSPIVNEFSWLHRWLYLPFDILVIVLPIWLVAWTYFAWRSLCIKSIKTRVKARMYRKVYSMKMISFLSLLVIGASMAYQLNSYTTTGCFTVEDKYEEGRLHYIVANDTKIKCDQLTFDHVVLGSGYALTYKGNTYTPNNGSLETILGEVYE